jgi:hypothetical protein
MQKVFVIVLVMVAFVALPETAPPPAPPDAMASAARAFLDTLSPDLKAKAQLSFDGEERLNWHYIPRERRGLPLKEMSDAQRRAAMNLLRSGLSERGYSKAEAVRALEDVLVELGGNPRVRDTGLYFFTVFGEPGAKDKWGWRYEGHHLSQNWTIVHGKAIATTPQFFGANPAEVRQGSQKGKRALAAEEDLAYEILASLDANGRKALVVSEKPPDDILTTNTREASMQEDRGLSHAQMTGAQKALLVKLIEEYVSAQGDGQAQERMSRIRAAGLDKVKFAWMGSAERGARHYYRIQGPTFLIELDNTQNDGNHIHSVWRDFKGDFGRDLLAEHYKTAPHD